jgi:anti-repressor protein
MKLITGKEDSGGKTMSSIEIAELTGKKHFHVMRDIENMLKALKIDASRFGGIYLDAYKREKKCYRLPNRECIILASGYDISLRAKIIDRWIELEDDKKSLPQTYGEALRALADATEEKEKADAIIALNAPKVEFADNVAESDNSMLIRQFTKSISTPERVIRMSDVFIWLKKHSYINKKNEPYQQYINQGLFDVVLRTINTSDNPFTSRTTKLTGKGVIYFTKKLLG